MLILDTHALYWWVNRTPDKLGARQIGCKEGVKGSEGKGGSIALFQKNNALLPPFFALVILLLALSYPSFQRLSRPPSPQGA
jgi:hypothetical protein